MPQQDSVVMGMAELPRGVSLVRSLRGHNSYVGRIAWSPNGQLLATPSNDATVRLWNPESGDCVAKLEGHKQKVYSVAFDPEGRTLASVSLDNTIRLWDPNNGRLLRTMESKSGLYSVMFDLKGSSLITAGDSTIQVWEPTSGRLLKAIPGPRGTPYIGYWLALHPLGHTLVCGATTLMLVEFPSGRLLRNEDPHDGSPINSVAFDPLGQILLTTSSDRTLTFCNFASSEVVKVLEGHSGESYCAAFSRDGRLIASKGGDSLRLWNYKTGASIAVPCANFGVWVPGLAFHPHQNLLAWVGSDPGIPKRHEKSDSVVFIFKIDVDMLFA